MSYIRWSRTGVLTALALAVIAACSSDSIVDPAPTPVPVASVSVSPATHSLTVGETVSLAAVPKAANGGTLDRQVVWSSEDEARATVSAAGLVTAVGEGQVTIRATSEGRVGYSLITVAPLPPAAVAEVTLSVDEEIVLDWDGRTQITATAYDAQGNELTGRHVQWTSTKPSVAAVWSGNIEAQNPGVALISAVIEGVAASVGVRVKDAPVVEVYIDAGTTGLEVGETFVFGSRVKRANGQVFSAPAQWSSNAPAIGRVAHQDIWYATIEALAVGAFTLTATAEGVSATLSLSVTPRPTHDLIYNRWSAGASEIFTLGLAAPGETPLRINAGNVSREPSPSPDGTQLVFAVSQVTPMGVMQHDLYVVNRNGLNMRWLTRTEGLEDQPEWSPDGSRILFHSVIDGKADLYTVNVDGTGLTLLTGNLPGDMTDKREASWSHDGTRIVFIGARDSQHKVWMVNADGTSPRQITTDAGFDRFPTFSPSGDMIAFNRRDNQTPANGEDVMFVPAQGGTPTRLALPGDQLNPAWSPDGRYLAVNGTAIAGQGQTEIYTMRPDGTGLRLRTVNPAWGGGFNPAWIVRP
ncbi:MAG TPA: Ig-like domain-containing protein [Gemmatimonadaceae bacterium]